MHPWEYDSILKGRASIQYTTQGGFFQQDDPKTEPSTFDFTKHDFGLREGAVFESQTSDLDATTWQHFAEHVAAIASKAPLQQRYKVLFIGRHGEGVHNVAEAHYGTAEWDRYWAKLPGDGISNWTDAALTGTGIGQAERNGLFWQSQVSQQKMQLPDSYYSSPLLRCLHTGLLTYQPVLVGTGKSGFEPTVKEMLRETNGVHTCDKRSSVQWICSEFPTLPLHFENGFADVDELWTPDRRETDEETAVRLKGLLDDIWCHDDSVWVSLTCHSGAGRALLSVLGHREWRLQPGEIIPVFVKADWKSW